MRPPRFIPRWHLHERIYLVALWICIGALCLAAVWMWAQAIANAIELAALIR